MADLLRMSRPWLLSPLNLRASSSVLSRFPRSLSTTSALGKRLPQRPQKPPEPTLSLLIPNAFVIPPLWKFPRDPTKFAHMLWLILKTRFDDLKGVMAVKVISMDVPRLRRPRFKYRKSAIVPAAKALHIQMSEAMAIGDKETLRSICAQELYQTLASAIDSRPRGVRSKWELVRYEKSWRYPRLASWKIGQLSQGLDQSLTKQAVVSIASVQRIARYDDSKGGVMINGSERVRHMVEHIVLQCAVHPTTFEASPWQIWGTLPESTYESMLQDIQDFGGLAEGRTK
ncbi:hypothetical protein F4805DRAFT_24134 [Annulohypoxylon moriforme]|nr:hypothetical protein F4805DRAFT_24134 [Annulohypoxylon moriforme]